MDVFVTVIRAPRKGSRTSADSEEDEPRLPRTDSLDSEPNHGSYGDLRDQSMDSSKMWGFSLSLA